MADEINLDTFLPQVGKNYIAPYVISIPTGTAYSPHTFARPVILQALTPATVGTIYAYPGNQPTGDDSSIPSLSGLIFLDGRGRWYVRHTSAGTERFRVLDAGGAGNAAGLAATALPPATTSNQVTWGAATLTTVNAASALLVAANTARRGATFYNASTGAQIVTLAITNPAVDYTGFLILGPGSGYVFQPGEGVTQQAVYVISTAAGALLSWSEGT